MEAKTMRINCGRRLLGSLIIALLGSSGQSAFATQGTFPHGYGVKSEGMGGVAIALAQDAMVGATNPAGMVLVGNRVDLGAAFLQVDNGAYFAGTRYDGSADKSLYIIPQLGANWMVDAVSSLGITVVGNGVGTNYDNDDNIGGLKAASSELKQMVATVSYAHKLGEAHALGVGVKHRAFVGEQHGNRCDEGLRAQAQPGRRRLSRSGPGRQVESLAGFLPSRRAPVARRREG